MTTESSRDGSRRIRNGVGFHADTVDGLRQAFHEAVEDYLETCAKIGKEPQKPLRPGDVPRQPEKRTARLP